MVRWMRWHCPSDTGFEIWALAVWGRARNLSLTEAPHSNAFLRVSGEETFLFHWKLKARVGFEPAISDFTRSGHCTSDRYKKTKNQIHRLNFFFLFTFYHIAHLTLFLTPKDITGHSISHTKVVKMTRFNILKISLLCLIKVHLCGKL